MKNNDSAIRDGMTSEMVENEGKTTRDVLYILLNKI